jgi:2-polyprenyl-3-methyl-5-hydroxy-6-metoxy-1,4-benzoquinol methylase
MTPWPPWACPLDGEPLAEGEGLSCRNGHVFPIRDGIPRFAEAAYAEAFGAQWLRYRRTQLDSHSGVPISSERARRCLGEELWEQLPGMQVLECGCGAGRFTEVLLGRGARVTSVDLSAAVEANAANFPPGDTHRIAQADILRLPFPRRSYDVVFCLGVVQHTPDPERTVAALYEQVRPGGWLVFDHYSRRLQWWLSTAPLARAYLKRLPPERGLRATERLVDVLLPLHRRAGALAPLLRRVSPVQAYYDKLPLDDESQREWALVDTHDALRDWHKHFRSRGQIERLLRGLGLEEIWVAEGGNGVEARGRGRPAA